MKRSAFVSCESFTQREFERWLHRFAVSDDNHYELLDGRIVMEPPAAWPHGESELTIGAKLYAWVEKRRTGRLFGASQGFELPSGDTVQPDVAYVSNERWAVAKAQPRKFPHVVPDLVVEVLSPSSGKRDRVQKKRIYERNGVREYWLVDPERREVLQLVRGADGAFDAGRQLGALDQLASVVLPGFVVPVGSLVAQA